MKSPLLVATSLSFVLLSIAASAQQGSAVTERVQSTTGLAPSRTLEQRSQSGGREIVVLTTELPGPDGQWMAVEEIATETSRDSSGTERTPKRNGTKGQDQSSASLGPRSSSSSA